MNAPDRAGGARTDVLDESVIESLRELGGEDDPGLLLDLIGIFLEDAPQRMREIEEGLATGDLKRVEAASHSLRSSSANLGALSLSKLLGELETHARTGAVEPARALWPASSRAWKDAAGALQQLRG